MSKDWIKINGVHSDDLNIWVDTPPIPPMAKRRRTISQIGFDEDVVTVLDSFDNLSITVYFYQINDFNSDDVYDNSDIFSFIAAARTLEMSRFEGWYYKVIDVSAIQPIGSYDANKVKYAVQFTVSPFKYAVLNSSVEIDGETVVRNYGNIYCRPLISFKAYSNGEYRITTNGDYFYVYVNDIVSTIDVVIDSTKMLTTLDGEIVNATTKGNYPMLGVGDNTIKIQRVLQSGYEVIDGTITPNIRKR